MLLVTNLHWVDYYERVFHLCKLDAEWIAVCSESGLPAHSLGKLCKKESKCEHVVRTQVTRQQYTPRQTPTENDCEAF
jgi:hypothetical protein